MAQPLYYLLFVDSFYQQIPLDPGIDYFWQIIATVFGGLLLWLYKRDLDRRDKREEKMTESISTLKTHVAVLSVGFEEIRKDLDNLIART